MLYTKGGNKIKILTKILKMKFVKKGHFGDWFFVVYSIFDIIITRASSSLAFRGHQEDLSLKGWHGNFLSVVQLFSRYDQVLHHVLEMSKGNKEF